MTIDMATERWVMRPDKRPNARVRLFCFPFAGGGASVFHGWSRLLPREYEVCSIQLPGRENRFAEPPMSELPALIDVLGEVLHPILDMDFGLLGHSMGALLSFCLASKMAREMGIAPLHLIVSAHRAPGTPSQNPAIHGMPRDELLDHVRRLRGTPPEILENRELMEMMLPTLRADFAVCETYVHRDEAPLACPITALGGIDDDITQEDLQQWKRYSCGEFSSRMFEGGHFFLNSNRAQVVDYVVERLRRSLTRLEGESQRDRYRSRLACS